MIFLELDLQAISDKPLDRKLVLLQEKSALFTAEPSLHPHEDILNDEYEEGGIAVCPMYIKMLSKYEPLLFTIILLFLFFDYRYYNFIKSQNHLFTYKRKFSNRYVMREVLGFPYFKFCIVICC